MADGYSTYPVDYDPFSNISAEDMGAQAAGQMAGKVIGGMARGLWNLPRESLEQSERLRTTGDYDPAPMVNAATLGITGGMPLAETGAAGIFGGRLAQTANLEKLARAQSMAGQRVHPLQIWHETGWFQGADGKWRFEIPDEGLQVNPGQGNVGISESAISHPELAKAYPQLSNLTHDVGLDPNRSGGLFYPPGPANPKIEAHAQNPELLRQYTGHELQHAVSDIEGFTPGTNPVAARDLVESIPVLPQGTPMKIDDLARQIYHRAAGEVEARNVERRMGISPIGRRIAAPWLTEDVPRAEQVVIGDPKGAHLSVIPVDHDPFKQ